ncbi:amino acid adenylation domain-containing protein [Streptomyces actuosus]|uniref:Amino acid adenylation domain-containing protein n=1 Tax=Streptomyces actuosus TaxID=1885 RepID=A0ABS2VVF1_STRAS|nr:non-ribosomal peptide synthetase [Streptomyces actuosus]MBN0047118.1 amino acid adenylation domain-containing protein [Streptomyces actuosus]
MSTPTHHAPLTVGQEAMWVSWRLDPEQWTHIIPTPFEVSGTLDVERLRRAVAETGEAFPQLRARVRPGTDGPVLDWSDAPEIPVRCTRTEQDRDSAIRAAWQTPFDLRRGPLARVDLIDGPDYTVLLIAVHHLVHDGASVLTLLDALRAAYRGEALPREDHGPALAAFAAHTRDLADGPTGEEHRLHWKETLSDSGDFSLPAGQEEPRYTVAGEVLPADLAAALRDRAAASGMSFVTVLLGAWFALLRRHSGSDDVLSFLPYHGRALPEVRDRVGYFVNALPVRVPVRAGDRYSDLLARVRGRVKETLSYGDLPLPAIMRTAGLTGPEAQRRTHQAVFQYWHAGLRDDIDVHDIRLSHGDGEARLSLLDMESTAGFRLALMVREDSCGTHLLWKDPAGSLGTTRVRAMADDYVSILRAIAADLHAPLAEVLASTTPARSGTDAASGEDGACGAEPDARVREMAEVWRSVLGSGPVGDGDSFFELGGHSLLAGTLVAAVRDRFPGASSGIRALFDHPRLADFTAHVLAAAGTTEPAATPPPPAPVRHTAPAEDTFPASSFQRRIWLAQRVAGDPAAYNVPLAWRVEEPLDADALTRALAATITRHEILRTAFHEVDGDLTQRVRAPWTPRLERVDLSGRPDPDKALDAWIRTAAHEPFDLATGRLLTAALIELGDAGQVLFVCLHHLLWDGECENILLKELDAHYTQSSGSTAAERPAGPHAAAPAAEDTRPASAHQERMWFVDRFETGYLYPAAPTYHNLPLFLRLDALPVRTRLTESVAAVVAAHEALRTELLEVDGRVVQHVRREAAVVPEWLPAAPRPDRTQVVPHALTAWSREPFDLCAGPLLRVAVQPDTDTPGGWIALSGHQAVVDRASLLTVAQQILAGAEGEAPRPSSHPRRLGADDEDTRRAHLAARAAVLRPPADPLRLPERRTRDAVHVYEERSVAFALPAGLGLRAAADRLGADVPEVALAAFAALLQWYSGHEDMVLGLSHAGRDERDRHVVGPLGNLLPVRLRPRARQSFADLVADTAAETAHARLHDRAPFDELVRAVDPSKDMSRTALFDVLYSYLPAAAPLPGPDGTTAHVVDTAGGRGKYDLHLSLQPDEDGHRAHLVYNALYFDHDQIADMAEHYVTAVRQLTERPECEVADIDPLSDRERHVQLNVWNATDASYDETPAHELIARQAEARPEAAALTDGDLTVRYGDLMADARAVARGLQDAGVRQGELVALLFPRGADQVRAILGTLLAGAAYLPIDPAIPADRREFILADSGVRLALAPSADADSDVDGTVLALDALLATPAGADTALPSVPLDSPAYCIYTSGTTGRPKGVVLTHRNLVRLLDNDRLPFSFGTADVWTMFHSYAFDFSVWELFGGLAHGGRVVLVSEDETRDPGLFFDLLQRERVTVLNQTPSAFRRLLGLRPTTPDGLSALRCVVFGGEALRPAMLTEWSERFPHVRLVNMYGITETTVHASVRTVTRSDMEADASVVGTPIPTTRLYLLDRHTGRRLLPVGAVGEIYVAGDGVAGGYLGRPELTAQRFVPSPFGDGTLFRSGDLAAYLPDGSLRFIGRADSQVQLRGYRIEPGEVQTVLCDHPDVSDAVVFAEDDRLVGVVQSERALTPGELRGHLGQRLPSYMLPSLFHVVRTIPLTVNGKVDVKELRAQTAAPAAPARREPRAGTAAELAAVWCDLLDVPAVSEDDSFFGLGGHSMLVVRLIGEIAERFGADLPIKTLFETPRLGDLADLIDSAPGRRSPATSAPAPTVRSEPLPATAPPLPDASAAPRPVESGTAPAPADGDESPASAFQRRMWLAEQMSQGAPAHVSLGWTVTGDLDIAVLEDALARLVAGHEILRTAFRVRGGTVRQIVQRPWRPRVRSFAAEEGDGPEEAAARWLDEAAGRPFDLASGQLLRPAVADCGPRGTAFMLCVHHLVVDGESVRVLVSELERCYRDSLAGVPSAPPALQYRAHTAAAERPGDARRDADLAFWQERLQGWPARLGLPAPERPEADGAVRIALPDGLLGRLRPVMAEHGASWFMVMAAALATALHRCGGMPALTFGVPASIRDTASADLLGPCLNLVVLRSAPAADATAHDALTAMRTEVLDAFEHARVPFDEVLARLRPEQTAGGAPYTDVVLNMNLRGGRSAVLGDAELRPVFPESLWAREVKFGATLTVTEQDGELSAVLSHRGDRVSAADAARLADAVAACLVELSGDAPPPQYRDFVRAQSTARSSGRHEASLAHWQERLRGAPAYVELPAPEEPAPHGVVDMVLPEGAGERLRTLHERHGISPFMTAATALAVLLHRRTGTDDVVISGPLTNRGRSGFADVFGPCLNTVPLRSRLRPGATVRDLLEAMRDQTLEALAHGEVPFEDVVDRLNPPRRPGRTPYGDVSLSFSTAPARPRTLGGRTLSAVAIDGEDAAYTGKLGLTVGLVLDGRELRGRMSYHGGLLRRADVEQLAGTLAVLLDRLPDSLDAPVAALDLLSPEESERIRAWERGPRPGPATTVPALVLQQARTRPDTPAVESTRGTLGYGGLVRRARALAAVLRPHLSDEAPAVALLLERGEDFVVAMLATWFAEAVFCPLDPSWPAARQEYVLADLGADVLLTSAGTVLPATGTAAVVDVADVPDDQGSEHDEDAEGLPDWSADARAYVIYTSGTTGKPKGVVVRHRGLANLVRSAGSTLGLGAGDRCSHLLSVSFDSSQMEVWQALANGACLVPHEEPVTPSTLGAWLDAKGVTAAFCATALAEAMWSTGSTTPRSLRWLGIGGAALAQRPPARLPYRVLNSYGPTENTVAASEHIVDQPGTAPLNCIGRPLAGVRMLVLDEAAQRVPLGTVGEIHLAGDSLAEGYLHRPELTAERFRTIEVDGGPLRVYRTGDLGRRMPDGSVEYLGRTDRQLKLRGYRIEPGEIEHFLQQQPEVAQAAVTGDPQRTPALVAYVTPRGDRTPTAAELLRRARAELPVFMVPDTVVVLAALPLTTSGKVDHAALPRPERADLVGGVGHVAPGNDTERKVAALWSEVLGLPSISVYDTFFDLGGNSLALAKLHSRIVAAFGRELPVTALFEHPTVSALARVLGAAAEPGRPAGGTPEPRRPKRSGRQIRRGRRRPGTAGGE